MFNLFFAGCNGEDVCVCLCISTNFCAVRGVVVKMIDLYCCTIHPEFSLPFLSGSVATVLNLRDGVELLQRALGRI